ncbi:hypothetical protein INH39_12005 [Massilia violaceinigra]|uniref:Uncharacterized protein n=1 Tax=Massilia violaceinigra TaxID=2045208 RepID=A0ABY4AFK2_9BURK|nr:hypothetical protein [Massilia violaceinigra]UOD32321.1 hypothetical protein INH39_12005 [Massilia violaceinigra]
MRIEKSMELEIAGPGFIIYSPFAAAGIAEGEDYLETGFENPSEVERQALEGLIVGVSTGSPGIFVLTFRSGYPPPDMRDVYGCALRLGVAVKDRSLCIRDLFDLIDWSPACPAHQRLELDDGFYHITLLSKALSPGDPSSAHEILVYLQTLNEMPALRYNGVPTLF